MRVIDWGNGDMEMQDAYGAMHSYGDDLLGAAHSGATIRDAARVARRRRLRTPRQTMKVIGVAPSTPRFTDGQTDILGADVAASVPLFARIRERFAAALPMRKLVRVDTPSSYADFRNDRHARKHADIDRRLDALEAVVLAGEGPRIPVDCPKPGAVKAWLDGDEICCSVAVQGYDGNIMYITTGEPFSRHLDEAAAAAASAGLEPDDDDVLGQVIVLGAVLGADTIYRQLGGAVHQILGCVGDSPVVGVLEPVVDVDTVSAMTLLQRCQMGDRRACAEVARIDPKFIRHALDRLLEAQRCKAKRGGI